MTTRNTPRILIVFGLIIVLLSMVGTAFAQADSSVYPLYDPQDGHQYVADIGDDRFDAEWTQDGRLWQPNLPDKQVLAAMEEASELESFTVAFKLVEGDYLWSGVECTLKLDPQRVGDGGRVEYVGGNAKTFSVDPASLKEGESETLPVAWASATCNGNVSTGFEILARDYSSDAPDPAATPEAEAEDRMSVEDESTADSCVSGSRDGDFVCSPSGEWVYAPAPASTPVPPVDSTPEPCSPYSPNNGNPLVEQLDNGVCVYEPTSTDLGEETPTDEGGDGALEEPIVRSYWSNRPWVALVLTILAIVAAIMFGVWAYKAFKATPAQKTKAIIFAIIAVVAGVAAIPLLIWFF